MSKLDSMLRAHAQYAEERIEEMRIKPGHGSQENLEFMLRLVVSMFGILAIDLDRLYRAIERQRSTSSIGVTLLVDRRSGTVDPITLPEHRTFSDRKTVVLFSPTFTDPADGQTKPDPDAQVTVSSSDEAQVGVERTDTNTYITTPLEAGSASITIAATSPNAQYADVILPFSYSAPIAGAINVTVGADVSDQP